MDKDGIYWIIVFTEMLEEFRLRYGEYPAGFEAGFIKDANIVNPDCVRFAKKAIDKVGGIKNGCLYKYGQTEHLLEMLKTGKILISPASYYKDPSLNHAINDDELNFKYVMLKQDTKIWNESLNCEIKPIKNVDINLSSKTDYYVQCMSTAYSYREFEDFECTSCLVIYDVKKYLRIIEDKLKNVFTGYKFEYGSVDYIDPLKFKKEPDVFFSKHFRFTYQNEFRIVWIPIVMTMQLDKFFVEIGNMEDYAKLITLEQ
ncbi:MAG: hypothetical protein AB7D29_02620 [Campylobacterales bacterium]